MAGVILLNVNGPDRRSVVVIHSEHNLFRLLHLLSIPPQKWDEYEFLCDDRVIANPVDAPAGLFQDRTIVVSRTYEVYGTPP
jgi:hypothetical protein